MAYDDWIKIRKILPRDARVRGMSKKLRTNVREVMGALVQFWSLADDHCDENGVLVGWAKSDVEDDMRYEGFCDAMPECWLSVTPEGWVKLPDYLEHNGSTAKARAVDSKRKRKERGGPKPVRGNPDKTRTRGEEKRVENIYSTPLSVPLGLQSAECATAWETWLVYKRKKRQGYKSVETQRQSLMAAAPHGPEAFCKSITDAIKNNYAGFFPEKFSRSSGQKQNALDRAREVFDGINGPSAKAHGVSRGGVLDISGDVRAGAGVDRATPAVLRPRTETGG